MKVNTLVKAVGASIGATVMALSVTAIPASADPDPATDYGLLAGVGSDTTQDIMNGFGALLEAPGGGRLIGSWDARPTVPGSTNQITTKDPTVNPNCDGGNPSGPDDGFVRPNGSTDGRRALFASENNPSGRTWQGEIIIGCVDFARSSSYPAPDAPQTVGDYTYLPVGVDAVSIAKHQDSDLPDNWTLPLLQAVYDCSVEVIAGEPVVPLLVQAGSGTRQFWVQQMGLTEAEVAASECIVQTVDGQPIQEHDGQPLANAPAGSIMPFSVAQWIAQGNSELIEDATEGEVIVEDRRGPAELNTVDFEDPIVDGELNILFPIVRDVYNVVPTDRLSEPLVANTFVGPNSLTCEAGTLNDGVFEGREITGLFGFGFRGATEDLLNQACGATALRFNQHS